jgi:hypothetical protein
MSETEAKTDFFDPTGMLRSMRDAGLENWSKMMSGLVHSDLFAESNGAMLDALLASSAPFRKSLETVMAHALANLCLPSREEVTRLAERLTHVELKLDDMDAKLDRLIELSCQNKS